MADRRSYRERRRYVRVPYPQGNVFAVFSCGDHEFAVARDELVAISEVPKLLRLPLVKPWFIGMASVHGYLVNVSDLSAYLGVGSAHGKEAARLLVVRRGNACFGLLVDRLRGIIECQPCQRPRALYPLIIEQYIVAQWCAAERCFDELDCQRLLQDAVFLNAAADADQDHGQ